MYFQPTDIGEMVERLRRLLKDPDLRKQMSKEGLAQAARFSWERAASETLAVYEQVTSA
jgi:glycosyltransferase involved in cell wall biosynthesis